MSCGAGWGADMALMTLSEYARHRGCSQPLISKWIKQAKIPVAKRVQQGKRLYPYVDSDVVDQILNDDLDPGMQKTATRGDIARKKSDAGTPDDPTPVGGVSKNSTGAGGQVFSKARGLRETYAAMTARMDYDERANKLIKIKLVAERWSGIAAQIKQTLMGIPSRTCANIAARYKAAMDDVTGKLVSGEPVTAENLQKILTAVLDDKTASDIIDAEIRETLQGLADGSFN